MIANPPFNSSRRYSEYRKFSLGFDVCGAGNTDNLGLNLLPDATRSWASTDFGGVNGSYTFKYRYTAYHPGEYWTHDWYITKLGWQPSDGISWASLEPVPFMVGHLAALDEYHTDTMPARTGAAAIVQVWSGPGGPDLPKPPPNPQFPKAGEFFTSCSDVDFGQQLLRR
jgi:hypothetical protein